MGNKKANDVFAKWRKTVKDNRDEKTICFISRGSWSDPQIAIYGKLLKWIRGRSAKLLSFVRFGHLPPNLNYF